MRRIKRRIIEVLMVIVITSPGAAQVATAQGDWTNSPTVKNLYEKARAEGQVVVWAPDADELNWIPASFSKRFPGVEVKWTADRAATTKAIAEHRAGRYTVDVFVWALGGILPLEERSMLASNDWTVWGVHPDDVFFKGGAAAMHNLVYTVVYNTDRVKEADLPKTWEGFLEPRFKDRLLASDFLMPRFLGFLALSWGEEKAIEYFRALRDRVNLLVVSGNAPRDAILKAGERLISLPDFPSNAVNWRKEGVPVAWVPVSPTGAGQFVAAPLARAPHPSAARLLAGWLATDEAKEIHEQVRSAADLRPTSRSKLAAQFRALGLKIVYEDVSNMKQRADLYNRFAPIVSGQQR